MSNTNSTSEALKVQAYCLDNLKSNSYEKNDMQKKVNVLVRLHEDHARTAENNNKFLRSYLINGLECTVQNILISLNTLFELHIKSKK